MVGLNANITYSFLLGYRYNKNTSEYIRLDMQIHQQPKD